MPSKSNEVAIVDKGGRPSKLTEELATRILNDIARGVPKTKAFVSNGICIATGYNWAEKDARFAEHLEVAEAQFESRTLKKIGEARTAVTLTPEGIPDWRALAMLLKMRRPEYRDNAVQVKVENTVVSNVSLSAADITVMQANYRRMLTGGAN